MIKTIKKQIEKFKEYWNSYEIEEIKELKNKLHFTLRQLPLNLTNEEIEKPYGQYCNLLIHRIREMHAAKATIIKTRNISKKNAKSN